MTSSIPTTTARPTDGSHLPVIHLNGSGRENLMEWLGDARYACSMALEMLYKAAPNGRDYYTKPGSYEVALAEFQRRKLLLAGLIDDMEADLLAIMDAGR